MRWGLIKGTGLYLHSRQQVISSNLIPINRIYTLRIPKVYLYFSSELSVALPKLTIYMSTRNLIHSLMYLKQLYLPTRTCFFPSSSPPFTHFLSPQAQKSSLMSLFLISHTELTKKAEFGSIPESFLLSPHQHPSANYNFPM